MRIRAIQMSVATALPVVVALALAGSARADTGSLADFTLEDLLQTEVITASKRAQPLIDTPSATYVISAADIRRSGATNIPDLLRRVPGLEVQQSTSSGWAVTARGFNLEFSNKLLVLVDGRSVYTPLFSGVFWDVQTIPLPDIDRIEVIRGPGASIWGANAVNGVINIITKPAADTQGKLMRAQAGNHERFGSVFRLGAAHGDSAWWRVTGQLFDRDELQSTTGEDFGDPWRQGRIGMRVDWNASAADEVRASANFYNGGHRTTFRHDQVIPGSGLPFPLDPAGFRTPNVDNLVRGGDAIASWTHRFSETSSTQTHISWDLRRRDNELFSERRQAFDLAFQHQLLWRGVHQVVWGFGARHNRDSIDSSRNIDFGEKNRANEAIYSGFLQDEIAVVPETLWLTLGSKIEWNSFTDWEVQPTARLMWQPGERQRVWAAASRSMRTPSRAEHDIAALTITVIPGGFGPCPGPGACAVQLVGNDDLDAERLLAYELGYRLQASDHLAGDVAVFFNEYENLATIESVAPGTPFTLTSTNRGRARSYGVEASGTWRVRPWWQLEGSFATFRQRGPQPGFESPGYRYSLRSQMDVRPNVELDLGVYFTDAFGGTSFSGQAASFDHHFRTDVRLAWHPRPGLELELVGQNLIDPNESEWSPLLNPLGQAEIPASIYARVTWEFE